MITKTLTAMILAAAMFTASAADKQIVLIAGTPSHGPLEHEHNALVFLLDKWLKGYPGVQTTAYYNGWPADVSAIEKADALFVFSSGEGGHVVFNEQRSPGAVEAMKRAAARGAGIMMYHYATEPPADRGHAEMLDWVGGYFELNYSVNPVFEGDFASLPQHPITRGVKPFKINDEWYYNIRFTEGMKGVTPILRTIPPPESLSRPDGGHSGNPGVRSKVGQPQTMVWAYERANGGRGVGWTGGHYHMNLLDDNFRKLVVNSVLWIAKVDVPANGFVNTTTREELIEKVDAKRQGRGGGAPPAAVPAPAARGNN
jgi:hypothetical protein